MKSKAENKNKNEDVEQKIKKIREIYNNFERDMAGLVRQKNELINKILKRVDEEKLKKVLKDIK
jgi:predicted transcriptional regulator